MRGQRPASASSCNKRDASTGEGAARNEGAGENAARRSAQRRPLVPRYADVAESLDAPCSGGGSSSMSMTHASLDQAADTSFTLDQWARDQSSADVASSAPPAPLRASTGSLPPAAALMRAHPPSRIPLPRVDDGGSGSCRGRGGGGALARSGDATSPAAAAAASSSVGGGGWGGCRPDGADASCGAGGSHMSAGPPAWPRGMLVEENEALVRQLQVRPRGLLCL
jgi:hypothetical protein